LLCTKEGALCSGEVFFLSPKSMFYFEDYLSDLFDIMAFLGEKNYFLDRFRDTFVWLNYTFGPLNYFFALFS
jgi:hypothetical protein